MNEAILMSDVSIAASIVARRVNVYNGVEMSLRRCNLMVSIGTAKGVVELIVSPSLRKAGLTSHSSKPDSNEGDDVARAHNMTVWLHELSLK